MPAPLAYSYLRFSSPAQATGDSIRRQMELRDAWLSRNHATLDTSISLRDEGKSAFTGEHRKNPDRHALAAFLKLVEQGKIPKGSYLIVENLDRLSREHIQPAMLLFISLLQAGVRVVQLLPVEQVFDSSSEMMQIMMAMMELSRGNSESKLKSERVGRAWAKLKRQAAIDKKPITPVVPAWLRVIDGEIVPIHERVQVVRRIYRLVISGHGMLQIARLLSSEGVPTFGRSRAWTPSFLHKIVSTRAAVGEYQPKKGRGREKKDDGAVIEGYYPEVVSEADWLTAQSSLASRHHVGRKANRNTFHPTSGLLVDARDGGKIYLAHSGNKRSNYVLVNHGAMYGKSGAKYVSFPAKAFTECVLAVLKEITAADVLDDDGSDRTSDIAALEGRKLDIESRIAKLQAAIEGAGEVKSAVASLRKLEQQCTEVDEALTAERIRVATPPAATLTDCQTLIEVFQKSDSDEVRARLKVVLRRLVSKVLCLFVSRGKSRLAAVQIHFADTNRHRDLLISYTQGVGNLAGSTPATWNVISDARVGCNEVDMSNKEDVRRVERYLASVDLESLGI